MQNNHYHCPNS